MADKYIRQIEKILEDAERSDRRGDMSSRAAGAPVRSHLTRMAKRPGLAPHKLVALGIALIVVSFALFNAFNYMFNQEIKVLLPVFAGLVLLLIVYGLLSLPSSIAGDKSIRGRMVDDGIPPSQWHRLRRWMRN